MPAEGPAVEPASVANRLARLTRQEQLDADGLGEVWRAHSADWGQVAVKIFDLTKQFDPDLPLRFSSALPFLRTNTHPVFPRVYDGGIDGDAAFLVMELLRAESLRHYLQRGGDGDEVLLPQRLPPVTDGALPPLVASRLIASLCDGLEAACDAKDSRGGQLRLAHGGITPSKIHLAAQGRVLLYGLGTQASYAGGMHGNGGADEINPLSYCAPEIIRGEVFNSQSDVFSLGAVLFELLTGQVCFSAASSALLIGRIVTGEVKAPSQVGVDVPAALDAVVARALEKSPAKRYRSPAELGVALREILDQEQAVVDQGRAQEALGWTLQRIEEGALLDVANLLWLHPDLGGFAELTEALWAKLADTLLDPLYEGRALSRVESALLAHAPAALTDLIGVLTDVEQPEISRVAAARLLARQKSQLAGPYLVRVLNEPLPWLHLAAIDALGALPEPQPLGADAAGLALEPCPHVWAELPELEHAGDETWRHCEDCDMDVVTIEEVAALYPLCGQACAFFDPPLSDIWGETELSFSAGTLSFTLAPQTTYVVGRDASCDVQLSKGARFVAALQNIGAGRLSVRLLDGPIAEFDVEEIVVEVAEGSTMPIGPLRLVSPPQSQSFVFQVPSDCRLQVSPSVSLSRRHNVGEENGLVQSGTSAKPRGVLATMRRLFGGG